ncbi:MAG: hypothetical protein ACD_75C00286G0001 [uncultured bacterium]|nr:MAG: hypothetical protein ACD_75C00286G0001 [uncultured bacterium]
MEKPGFLPYGQAAAVFLGMEGPCAPQRGHGENFVMVDFLVVCRKYLHFSPKIDDLV